ncbi:hypothetical protein [uncultured Ruegeria sp.]|uniref:hypothetical protein n=1 Tax=uncultured Ruegeria sp. TaxID=259304 RepID=UPI002627F7D1|nr:hypothetical protein [uncultured Ruegeria sp.]
MSVLETVRYEITDIHEFFADWFNGNIARDQLESRLLSRFDDCVTYISPEGHVVGSGALRTMFENSYGANTGFKIQIHDVAIRQQVGTIVLATYTEWQIGVSNSDPSNNARITSALIDMGPPVKWLHIHETWLPEKGRAAGSFDF